MDGILNRLGSVVLWTTLIIIVLHILLVSAGVLIDQHHYPIIYAVLIVPAAFIWLCCKAFNYILDL